MHTDPNFYKNPLVWVAIVLSGGGGFLGSWFSTDHDTPVQPDLDQYVKTEEFEELKDEVEELDDWAGEYGSHVFHNHQRIKTIEHNEGYVVHDFKHK